MKNLLFAFTGVIAFLLIAQLLYARNYAVNAPIQSSKDTQQEQVGYTPPDRGFPAMTLPSGTR
ncbi:MULTISPECIES: hypothetical protein [unclassified Spirulina]|uniref:hypothetical protein n=1 Tax=unclassified Spirulina TaxID=2684457 RepID=UPI0019528D5C|nr:MULTISPECIES: hypothetical protein [Spirulina]MEA5471056.1 hypothetical protein [Spirulina sp. 06S082]